MNIDGKLVVITGGARGIGRGIAEQLLIRGARIALLDNNIESLRKTVDELSPAGEVRGYSCDVTCENEVADTFSSVSEYDGAPHALINNAGIIRDSQLVKVANGEIIDQMSLEDFELVSAVHMKGAFLCTREAVRYMIKGAVEEGCIINISSGAFRGNFGQTNYSAAKAALVAMSRVWSLELSRYNIRSVAIAPGIIETDMLSSMPEHELSKLKEKVPLKRTGNVKHITRSVEYVLENDYLTGNVEDVAGGVYF